MKTITLYVPHTQALGAVTILALLLAPFAVFLQAVPARAAEDTVELVMEKKFSGPVPSGYSETQFSFDISGPGVDQNISVASQNAGFYSAPLSLTEGVYTIREVGPEGFESKDWRVQWSGECTESPSDNLEATLVVNSGNVGDGVQPCRADNQWRPWSLFVQKNIVGTSTAPTNFSFAVTQGSATIFDGTFEADAENEILLGRGTYAVTEDATPGYTTTYSSDCSGTVATNDTANKHCLITNMFTEEVISTDTGRIIIEKQTIPDGNLTNFTFDPSWSGDPVVLRDGEQSTSTALAPGTYNIVESPLTGWVSMSAVCSDGSPVTAVVLSAGETVTCVFTSTFTGGGGNGNNEQMFQVFGYVWHDTNENDIWDIEQPNPVDDELDLDGWTVQITNGSVTQTTVTNDVGYYTFEVPPGTWTITEMVQSGWGQTFPNGGSHVVVVEEQLTQEKSHSVLAALRYLLVQTASAQTLLTYGPFNFGNVAFGAGGSSVGNGGGGGGNGKKVSLSDNGGGGSRGSDDGGVGGALVQPPDDGEVLGATASAMPVGAPDTGRGGAAPQNGASQEPLVFVLREVTTIRKVTNAK